MASKQARKDVFKVAVVIGSQRAVRICPQVAQFVLDVIKSYSDASVAQPKLDFSLLDIADFDLPLTDETALPAQLQDIPAGYGTEATRAWSRTVAERDAFVFVTPQYNWGVPAGLKNALDHLFHEWTGKPAMVVSYGGHGGTVGAAALITVLSGIGLRVVRRAVCMKYPDPDFMGKAVKGQGLDLDAASDTSVWANRRGEIIDLWKETHGVLVGTHEVPSLRSAGLLDVWTDTLAPVASIELKAKGASK
ncbi:NADPH-dependent FMN reductase-domain-containing protein [Xylariales sp. PMI_506]|nr:NADPH-dependent FMN reductase-domain-containing protein [Xylariales sp. PMI_506]